MSTTSNEHREQQGKTRTFAAIVQSMYADMRMTRQKVPYGAVPYLEALAQIDSTSPKAIPMVNGWWAPEEDAHYLALYALSNLQTYKGEGARALKKELKNVAGIR